jgi:hypothetical protein
MYVAEKTLVMPVDYLPQGVDWQWMPELNMVLIRDTLDELEGHRALIEVSAVWRRSCLRVVGLPTAS